MIRMHYCVATAAMMILSCGLARQAGAEYIDQANEVAITTNWNIRNLAPIGQEFTPTFTTMDFVDLIIADAGSGAGPGADFQVHIRQGTIDGTILGTSRSTFVADDTNIGGGSIVTRFLFDDPVALTPGSLHVLQVVQLGAFAPGTANYMLSGVRSNTYAGGRAIREGTPDPNSDFFFRTGLTSIQVIPEPSSLALVGIGALGGLITWRRHRRTIAS